MTEKKIIPKKERFSEWYVTAIENAEILDQRYPVKGFPVYAPWGFQILREAFHILEHLLENEDNVLPVLFPIVIPEDYLKKESEHIRGFEGEVFWVTHGGKEKLPVRLALRPTSETAMYPMFAYWIRSYTDLPLKVHQTCTIYRYETKHTRMLLRGREVFWNEAHTAHATWEDAYQQVLLSQKIYSMFFKRLGLAFLILKRPVWDKFAGADFTTAFDAVMPDGKTLQIGTVHHLGENFAKAFEITYLGPDQKTHYVSQTSYGISMRVLGAVIAIHGDDIGIILPPEIAPIKVVIVPIPAGDDVINKQIDEYCKDLEKEIQDAGIKVKYDNREYRPGEKYYYWERKGIPIRLEIGKKEVTSQTVTMARRDTKKKTTIPRSELIETLKATFDDILKTLSERAENELRNNIRLAKNMSELKSLIKKYGGFVKVPYCSIDNDGAACAEKIKEETGADVKGVLFPEPEKPEGNAKCIVCGRPAKYIAYIAKSY